MNPWSHLPDRFAHLFDWLADRTSPDLADLLHHWLAITETWDDLVDGDRAVSPDQVHDAFHTALVVLPANPLYRRHGDAIRAALACAVSNWIASNALATQGVEERLIAHTLRYSVVDVAVVVATLEHGHAVGAEVAAHLRTGFRHEPYTDLLEQ